MKIALLGNPNTGKSSVFNYLTGLRQHIGNFPGITVDLKKGYLENTSKESEIIDFPGTYSIYPRSLDEQVVYKSLESPEAVNYPDLAIVVCDATNLERNLFLFTQVYDLHIPTILVLNMSDAAAKRGKILNLEVLQSHFPETVIVQTNARIGMGMDRLKTAISTHPLTKPDKEFNPAFRFCGMEDTDCQSEQASLRYARIQAIMPKIERVEEAKKYKSSGIDRILVHRIWGYLIFALILLVIFQFIFSFATYPMDLIDMGISNLSSIVGSSFPPGLLTDLLAEGIIPGIGGVLIFIPQIALLFFFISILEESGYLARVVFIMDRLMRPLGLSGKSVVPLISSVACAIPGVMAARVISDWKERLTTILVAPLMSCSARIPVYTLLIALVIPQTRVFGFINMQGLVLFGLYFLGLIGALFVAWILKLIIKSKTKSFLIMELPSYKIPRAQNIGLNVWEKVRLFVVGAGKIIVVISIVLWALAKFGPPDRMQLAEENLVQTEEYKNAPKDVQQQRIQSVKLENSFIGIMGKSIEPIIKPLGYDWKIGIALITDSVMTAERALQYADSSPHRRGRKPHPLPAGPPVGGRPGGNEKRA